MTVYIVAGIIREKGREVLADVPIASINEITHKLEPCLNNRGRAYALRRADRYRRRRRDRDLVGE